MVDIQKRDTCKEKGYRMPAEWEPQEAVWLSWPHNVLTFGEFMNEVRTSYAHFASAVSIHQKVKMLVSGQTIHDAKLYLEKAGAKMTNVGFYDFDPEDVWIRDYGPTFVVNKNANQPLAMVKWNFNAWGNKYQDLLKDQSIPEKMLEIMKIPIFRTYINLEGGSIDVNGKGIVMTTEQCLLNKNRNPQYSKSNLEQYLFEFLNTDKVIWLKEGIIGDDTDGHIDDIARFVSPKTIVCAFEENEKDPNYAPLLENYNLLQKQTDLEGNRFKIIKIPMPEPVKDGDKYLPASYINFYIANDVVAVPIFGCEKDEEALAILQKEFPKREVIGINCREFVYGLGTLHCSSQQEPSTK